MTAGRWGGVPHRRATTLAAHGRLRRGGPRRARSRTATSPTTVSRRPSSSRYAAAAAAPRGRGGGRQDRGGPGARRAGPAASWSGCSATRASTPARRVYEWDYSRQLLHLRAAEASGADVVEDELYSERFLVRRPLLRGDRPRRPAARAAHRRGRPRRRRVRGVPARDPLRLHGDVPELGVIRAEVPPIVVLTSNRTRDVHDALKRRCLYHWIDHPDFERELAIVRRKAPEVATPWRARCAAAVEVLRELDLYKPPGRRGDDRLGAGARRASVVTHLDEAAVAATLGTVLKYREDQQRLRDTGCRDRRRRGRAQCLTAPAFDAARAAVAFARVLRAAGLARADRRTVTSPRRSPPSGGGAVTTCTGRAGPRCAPARGRRAIRRVLPAFFAAPGPLAPAGATRCRRRDRARSTRPGGDGADDAAVGPTPDATSRSSRSAAAGPRCSATATSPPTPRPSTTKPAG